KVSAFPQLNCTLGGRPFLFFSFFPRSLSTYISVHSLSMNSFRTSFDCEPPLPAAYVSNSNSIWRVAGWPPPNVSTGELCAAFWSLGQLLVLASVYSLGRKRHFSSSLVSRLMILAGVGCDELIEISVHPSRRRSAAIRRLRTWYTCWASASRSGGGAARAGVG